MATNLTKNFTLEELTNSTTATKYGIDNRPNSEIKANLQRLASEVLQPIRDKYGAPIIVSSGYRCEKLNTKINGAKSSDHKFGCAADIKTTTDKPSDNKNLFNLITYMAKQGEIKCRQIIDEYGYDWIHISINNKYNSWKDNQILHLK